MSYENGETTKHLFQLPESLCDFCCNGIYYKKDGVEKMKDNFFKNSFYMNHIAQLYNFKMTNLSGLRQLVFRFGLNGIIERISETSLFYDSYQRYPTSLGEELVSSVKAFEKRFRFMRSQSGRRTYLLGHYLKSRSLLEQNTEILNIPSTVDELAKSSRGDNHYADWYLYSLILLCQILPEKKVKDIVLEKKNIIDKLFDLMSDEQETYFIKEMIKYGFAIRDKEFLLYKKAFV